MARPESPPGGAQANEHAHVPTTLPSPPPEAPPASPPGGAHANEHAQVPTTLPPEHDDTLVFAAITDSRTLPEDALTHANDDHAHLPSELPAVQSHELPEAAGHMSQVAVDHLPDWLLLS